MTPKHPPGPSTTLANMREPSSLLTASQLLKEEDMTRLTIIAFYAQALLYAMSSAALAQTAPPSFQADPNVYKVIFEDENFRIITATWDKGVHDKAHSHTVPSVVFFFDDCAARLHASDGKATDATFQAGTARTVPLTQSHSVENIGPDQCRALVVERK